MTDIFSLYSCYPASCTNEQLIAIKGKMLSTTTYETTTCTNSDISNTNEPNCITLKNCNDATKKDIKNQLNELKEQQEATQTENINKTRLLQINTYYGKKRLAQNVILKTIATMIIVVIALWLVGEYFPIIPSWIVSLSMSITLAVCSLIIIFKASDMSHRNNMDYDTYDIPMSKDLPPTSNNTLSGAQGDISSSSSSTNTIGGKHCKDNACCPKFYTFNSSLGYCGLNPFVN
jgi:hypothetical protein